MRFDELGEKKLSELTPEELELVATALIEQWHVVNDEINDILAELDELEEVWPQEDWPSRSPPNKRPTNLNFRHQCRPRSK